MLLCMNIGNTNISIGIFNGENLVSKWRLATDYESMPDEYALKLLGLIEHTDQNVKDIDQVVISSVVPPLTGRWVEVAERYLGQKPFHIDHESVKSIKVAYHTPEAVGADRLANAVAVNHHYGLPACIVDFGTATTFDAVSKDGEYLGGAIAPGMRIASEALFARTAKLPKTEIVRPPTAIGRNTTHAIQSGIFFGYVGLVEGIVNRFKSELGPGTHVIGTGGGVDLIASGTKLIDEVAPWLTLEGIRLIFEENKKSP
ncbi:MAG: type III pantothenate kinase [Anaerolineaceae bacterium]|nr:type III pantothenate kinase [Anaerolineaceae bacterium]MBN2677183.1 type III pantothenate kinase [Anaerolineaceae bacterium]